MIEMEDLKEWCTSDLNSQELSKDLFAELSQGQLANIEESLTDWQIVGQDEETIDVALVNEVQVQQLPVSGGPPARGNYTGPLSFEVQVNGKDTHKKKYLYSHKLNRIYVEMLVNFPVQFRWAWRPERSLLVRATPVFADESDAEKRVERCLQHVHPDNNLGFEESRWHILRSTRPPNSEGVFYCGSAEDQLSWYSVAVLMQQRPEPGAAQLTHAYSFHCKSSCNSGINRRPIEIIFTLEDSFSGEVLGRQSVGARVCSCPRRDLKKDEESLPAAGKRRCAGAGVFPPPGKRFKTEPGCDDVTVFNLPPIIGHNNYKLVLEVMKNAMVASSLEMNQESSREAYTKYIDKCERALLQQNK